MPDTPGQEGAQGHAPNPTEIRVFSTGKSLRIEPFKIPENPLEVGRAWREWIEDFEDETSYFEITEIRDRVSALKIYGGKEIKKLARNLPDTAPVVGDDDYKKLKRKLDKYFLPKKNKHHGRFTFSKQRPIEGESVITYAARLREKSKDCEFTTTLRNKNRGTHSKFLVIQGKMDSPPLLSKSTLLELGMLKIDPEGTLKETNELRIKTVKTSDDSIEAALSEYSDVFQGIGCFREKSTGKKIEVKLEMEPDAEPVAQKPRPVPYHLQKPLKDWLDQGVNEEIFEKVPDGEAITWCSPLVVQPKPKFTDIKSEELESHMIRASIDMRIPNQSMKRSRCVQSPRVEDFI